MTAGRCAGCGKTDNSCKKMRSHVMSCPDYIKIYREDPVRALDPEDELIRFNAEEGSSEARADAKAIRLEKRFEKLDGARLEQMDRWKPRDLLAD